LPFDPELKVGQTRRLRNSRHHESLSIFLSGCARRAPAQFSDSSTLWHKHHERSARISRAVMRPSESINDPSRMRIRATKSAADVEMGRLIIVVVRWPCHIPNRPSACRQSIWGGVAESAILPLF
jgi:hypothetical protein